MAETAVGAVIQNLGSLIIEEIKSLGTVRKQLRIVKRELEIIRRFLKNADEKAAAEELDQGQSNEGIRIWVQQIREEAYHIEDVIDEFTFLVAQLNNHGTGLDGVLARFCHCMKMLNLRYKIASDIKNILSSLVDIDKTRERYGLKIIEEGPRNGIENVKHDSKGDRSYFIEEDQIVGNEALRKELIDWLIDERPQRRVLAMVGAGGLGKTTLVASVYKWPAARNCFDCYAWIEVGRAYNKEDACRKLLIQFSGSRKEPPREDLDTMDSRELIDLLREYLKEKRYMVVFDDVRQADFWKYVEHFLLDNGKANRIFITTRNRDVADFIPGSGDHICVCVLEGLAPEEAWQLFCRKAFSKGVCPAHLEKLSHDILEKCDGLPLAIVAVGDLLSKKNEVENEWQELVNNLGSELERDIYLKDCNRVLCESYSDIPHHLKPCLLYFTLFPASHIIECERLIRLWIAEGFVQLQDNKNRLHEVAERYLTELIRRSLVQVSETSIDGKATSVRVHELMHEIIQRKAKQFGFSQVLKEQEEQDSSQQRQTRRITIYKSANKVVESVRDSKVRSVFLFEIDELHSTFICTLASANFKLMKVLDFQGAPLHDNLPKEVGSLFNLRYLSLRKTKVKVLPKSIGKLFNLDTLDLRRTLVIELPNDIRNLTKLRCLLGGQLDPFGHTYGRGMKVQEAIGSLTELQELTFVEADFKATKELGKLRKLRKLGLRVTNGKGKDLCASISNMEDLKSLDVESMDRDEIINLQSIASPPQGLGLLYLTGILKKLPDWISNLQNLVTMHLDRSGLIDDPLKVLHGLPNLMELSLVEAYNAEYLHFADGWFPKLKSLKLVGFKGLKSMIIDNGTMPLLESLKIESSPLLDVPTGISNLKSLIELILVDMPKEFADEIRSSKYSFKVFASRIVGGKYITETNNPPLRLELQKITQDDEEGKDFIGKDYNLLVQPKLQQANGDDEKGNPIIEKDTSPIAPELQQASQDGVKGKDLIEKDYSPFVQAEFQQASKDDKGKIFTKDYSPLILPNPQQISRYDEERNDLVKKDYSSLIQSELQQGNKDDEGKHIAEKDYIPPVLPELQQANKDEEGKNITLDYTPPIPFELQQASKEVERENIIEKDCTPPILFDLQQASMNDEEGKDLTENDHSPLKQPELQQAGKDYEEGKHTTEKDYTFETPPKLQQASKDEERKKDEEEGKHITEKEYTPLIPPQLQQTSTDHKEGRDLIEKDYSPLEQPELQQASKKDEKGKHIIEKDYTPSILPELQEAGKEDEEEKVITEKDYTPLIPPELQQANKDDEEKIITEKDHGASIQPEPNPAIRKNLARSVALWKDNVDVIKDGKGKHLIEKDYSPPIVPKLQQTSKDDEESKNIAKKDYSPPAQPEPKQSIKDFLTALRKHHLDVTKSSHQDDK